MLYYKYEYLTKKQFDGRDEREGNMERIRRIAANTDVLIANAKGSFSFCIVSTERDKIVVLGVFGTKLLQNDAHIREAQRTVALADADAVLISYAELTERELVSMLRLAERSGYLSDDSNIIDPFELDGSLRHGGTFVGREGLAEDSLTKDRALKAAAYYCCKDSLVPELNRIFDNPAKRVLAGHPVHYLIRTSDDELTQSVLSLLICALYTNKRVASRRYTTLDMAERLDRDDVNALYNKAEGGSVVLNIAAIENDSEYASDLERNLDIVTAHIKQKRNNVLTVICMNSAHEHMKERLAESLPGIAFIDVCEDVMSVAAAKEYLRALAANGNVTSLKGLCAGLDKLTSLNVSALKRRYEKWFSKYLVTVEYPLYGDVAKPTGVAEKPAGSAYDELQGMIGLDAAKKALLSAVDYFKAQRVFGAYKAFEGRPSMHMVFSGNPGTAKTTAARLFAKIMYENRLLSTGDFVEVGRSDLVGQYVGWTAPIVKKKFRQAKGGVLFIDEAYSLLDDRGGMFGDEAINTIVQEMENMREDIVVIFAGYPDRMKDFLERNPGLSSRIAFHIDFPDYSPAELLSIAEHIALKKGRVLSERARLALSEDFKYAGRDRNFGNGRYVRNIIERALMNQATRLLRMGYDNVDETVIRTLEAEDIALEHRNVPPQKSCIGFQPLAHKTLPLYN